MPSGRNIFLLFIGVSDPGENFEFEYFREFETKILKKNVEYGSVLHMGSVDSCEKPPEDFNLVLLAI